MAADKISEETTAAGEASGSGVVERRYTTRDDGTVVMHGRLDDHPVEVPLLSWTIDCGKFGFPGAVIDVHIKWWGHEEHLNEKACEHFSELAPQIAGLVGQFFPTPLGELIEWTWQLRADAAYGMREFGCKLVSPWILPGLMIPVSLRPSSDRRLYFSVFDPAEGWNDREHFSGLTRENPAIAQYRDTLVCVYRGATGTYLYYSVYDRDNGWSNERKLGDGQSSQSSPALAVFQDKLHCVYRGATSDKIWWNTFDGTNWTFNQQTGETTSSGPALAVFQNRLYCAFRGASSSKIWTMTFNGTGWGNRNDTGHSCQNEPALAVFQNRLHLVYRGATSNKIWHTSTSNGSTWNSTPTHTGHTTSDGVGLAVFDNKLYCAFSGATSDKMYWQTFNGSSWDTTVRQLSTHQTGHGPALIAYHDSYSATPQLMLVQRGHGN